MKLKPLLKDIQRLLTLKQGFTVKLPSGRNLDSKEVSERVNYYVTSISADECGPDTAAIVGCITSLLEAGERHATKYDLDISGEYNGMDEWMRCVYKVSVSFETWACEHVDFEELDGCWPYTMEDQFGDACIDCYGQESDHYKNWGEKQNRAVAEHMDLPLHSELKLTTKPKETP